MRFAASTGRCSFSPHESVYNTDFLYSLHSPAATGPDDGPYPPLDCQFLAAAKVPKPTDSSQPPLKLASTTAMKATQKADKQNTQKKTQCKR
jgi:hypothetical protein